MTDTEICEEFEEKKKAHSDRAYSRDSSRVNSAFISNYSSQFKAVTKNSTCIPRESYRFTHTRASVSAFASPFDRFLGLNRKFRARYARIFPRDIAPRREQSHRETPDRRIALIAIARAVS